MVLEFISRRRWEIALTGAILVTLCVLIASEVGHRDTIAALNRLRAVEQDSRSIAQFMGLMTDAETGQRGFLLNPRDVFLQRYQSSVNGAKAELAALLPRIKSGGDAESLARIGRIATLAGERFTEMEMVVRKIQEGDRDNALGIFETDIGRRKMQELRKEVTGLLDHNQVLATRLNRQAADVSRYARIIVAAVTIVNILLLVFVLRQLGRAWREKEREAVRLKAQREWLDAQVKERTEQLTQLSVYLQDVLEAEKSRLARELHDELGAILTAAKMDVAWVRRKLDRNAGELGEKLERTIKNIDQGIMVKRRLIEDLRPSTLSSFGLVVAARELAEETAARNEWELKLELPEAEPDIDADTATALYRVLQESLNNATKYAQAKQMSIRLDCSDRELTLTIEDNGVGFRPSQVRPKALGLVGMRQRVQARGGSFEVSSHPGAGCRVRVILPLRHSEECVAADNNQAECAVKD